LKAPFVYQIFLGWPQQAEATHANLSRKEGITCLHQKGGFLHLTGFQHG